MFLFDEPLSNLDAKLRVQMRTEIKRVHQKVKTTTVYVTHDQVEAMTLADRVVVMNGGKIEQIGTPNDLYHHPKTRFVAGFIGSPAMNFIPAKLEGNGSGLTIRLSDKLSFQVPESRAARYRGHVGKDLLFGLRPEHITETRGRENGVGQEFSIIARRGRADGHGDDGVFHRRRHRSLRPRRTDRRQGRRRDHDVARQSRSHASDRSGDQPGAVTVPSYSFTAPVIAET